MKEIVNDKNLVAYCGLYCGACDKFRRDKCKGCHENNKAAWCKIRTCCIQNNYLSCADCSTHQDPQQCKLFNNLISKIFSLIFKSDRKSCIEQIRRNGIDSHASEMSMQRAPTIKRK